MITLPLRPIWRERIRRVAIAGICAAVGSASAADADAPTSPPTNEPPQATIAIPSTPVGSPHDFDFEHGRWHTALRRRLHPLSGSDAWAEYAGTTVVSPVLGGRANLVELDVSGPEGRLQGLSLRLFEPARKQWTLNFANASSGTLVAPMAGGFAGGARGVFYSVEEFDGRRVLVRFVIESTSATSARFEQAFSADGGATWETNWIAVDTRS